jgi:hypothetical protein
MINEKAKEIMLQCSREKLQFVTTGYRHEREVDYDEFAQQIVGETVAAILCTDCRSLVYTTHDRAVVDSVIGKVIDQVRDHWSLK